MKRKTLALSVLAGALSLPAGFALAVGQEQIGMDYHERMAERANEHVDLPLPTKLLLLAREGAGPGGGRGPGGDRGPGGGRSSGDDRGPGGGRSSGDDRGPGGNRGPGGDRGSADDRGPGSDSGFGNDRRPGGMESGRNRGY